MTKLTRKMERLFTDITFAEDRIFNPTQEGLSKIARRLRTPLQPFPLQRQGSLRLQRAISTRMERLLNADGQGIGLKAFQSLAPQGIARGQRR